MLQRHNYESFKYLMFKINKDKPNKKTKWIPWKLGWFTQSSLLSKCMDWVSFWRRRRRRRRKKNKDKKKKKRFQGSHFVQRASGRVVVILCVCVCGGVSECVNEFPLPTTFWWSPVGTGRKFKVSPHLLLRELFKIYLPCWWVVCEGHWVWGWCVRGVCEDMSGWMSSGQMVYIIFIVYMSI